MSNNLERRTTMNEKTTANHSIDEAAVRNLYQQLMDG